MRLLQVQDDGELSLVEYVGKDIPRYAILSHTWGADQEEVNFRDLMKNSGKSKPGYEKLRFCSKQATNDGLRYFWIDTCCIDKSSSAELSEAINSMFQWYSKASKCYAYLSDVSTTGPSQGNQSIQNSRWFSRGWTLQELIAPASVDFFSVEGHRLGDKQSLQQTLCEITRIPVDALQSSPLSEFSVNERMSWAEARETKREEDAAYSLLGIFDIHMPLLYGEGREKAFNRLRREIEQASGSASLALLPVSNVPFRRDPDFVNRGTILSQVREKCSMPASRAALVGLGGVGKSQIAIEYSYRVREESPTTWVFWVHASTEARFEEGYRAIAETTRMSGWDNPKLDILKLVRSWLCDQRNGQWVMFIDNADDGSVFSRGISRDHGAANPGHSAEPLSDFLPQSPNGSIFITSRSRDVAYNLTGSYASIIDLKAMDKNDALALLGKKLSPGTSRDNAVELLQTLDYLPLAITQAAAFIEQRTPRMTISRYVDELRRSDLDRARLLENDVGDSRRDSRASNSTMATWQISFEYIRKHMPAASRLLALMSLFDRQGIPESLLHNRYRAGDEEVNFDDDIATLTSYSLVEASTDRSKFEMHQLVQFSTRKWLELHQELEQWKKRFIILLNSNYPVGRYKEWTKCQALFPHAQAVAGCRPMDTNTLRMWASVLYKAGEYAFDMGQYDTCKELAIGALEAREATLGGEHPDTLVSISQVGSVLERQGKYKEAEAMHRRDLEGSENAFGTEHPETLASVANLGLVLFRQGKYEGAELMDRRATEGYEKTLGPEHPYTLTSASNLGSVLERQGKYEEAEAIHQRALEAQEKVLGPEDPDTLTTVSSLGSVLGNQGKYEEAEAMHRKALKAHEKVLGPEHPDTLGCVANLGIALSRQGKYGGAELMDRRAIEGYEKTLGPEHPYTLTSVSNLGLVLERQGKYEEAEALHQRALKAKEKVLGPEHPDTLSSVTKLGSVLGRQGKYEEAEAMHRKALEGLEKVLVPEHLDTLSSVNNLAWVLSRKGKYEEAEIMYRRALEGRERVLGPEHPDTLASVNNLALALSKKGKYEEAQVMHRRALEGRERVLGPVHPSTLASVNDLGLILESRHKYKEAEIMFRRALQGSEETLGSEHPDTLTSVNNLGLALSSQGKNVEAEAMHRRALEARERVLRPDHPDTLICVAHLTSVLEKEGKYEEAMAMHRRTFEGYDKTLGLENINTHSSTSVTSSQCSQGRASTKRRRQNTDEILKGQRRCLDPSI